VASGLAVQADWLAAASESQVQIWGRVRTFVGCTACILWD